MKLRRRRHVSAAPLKVEVRIVSKALNSSGFAGEQ